MLVVTDRLQLYATFKMCIEWRSLVSRQHVYKLTSKKWNRCLVSTINNDALFNESTRAQDIAKLLHSDFLRWWCGIYYEGKRENFGWYTAIWKDYILFIIRKEKVPLWSMWKRMLVVTHTLAASRLKSTSRLGGAWEKACSQKRVIGGVVALRQKEVSF